MRAGDVPGLVLHPDAAGAESPSASLSSALRANGVTENPCPSTAATCVVERAHERAEVVVGEPAARGDVVGVEQRAVADERVRLAVALGEADGREVELAAQDVVDVVARPAFGQRNGYGSAGSGLGAAAGADESADEARLTAPPARRCAR